MAIPHPVVEPLEPRRLLSAGDVIDTETLPGRSQASAFALINLGESFYAFTSGLNGNVSVALIRFDGTLVTGFGDGGWISTGLTRNGISGSSTVFAGWGWNGFGMIYSTGDETGIAVFDHNGNPDTSFSDDGRWQADFRLERVERRSFLLDAQKHDELIIAGTEKVNANRRRAIVRQLDARGNSETFLGGERSVDLGLGSHVTDLKLLTTDDIRVVVNRAVDGTNAGDQQRVVQLRSADGQFRSSFGGGDGIVEYDDPLAAPGPATFGYGPHGWSLHKDNVMREYDVQGTLLSIRRDMPGRFLGRDSHHKMMFLRTTSDGHGTEQSFVTRLFPDGTLDRAFRQSGTTPLGTVPIVGAATIQSDEIVVLGNSVAEDGSAIFARIEEGAGLRASIGRKGTLAVRADDTIDGHDVIEVARRGRDGRIVVRSKGGPDGINWIGSFAPSRVKRISVETFGGNDSVVIGRGVKGSHVNAGDGDDSITGGDGGDLLFGGDRDDLIVAGDGTDRLLGGPGADTIFGGGDDDTLWGEAGDDRVHGGAGTDAIFGGEGFDGSFNDRLDDYDDIEQLID